MTTITKTKSAQKLGNYKATGLDTEKNNADYLLIDICGNTYTIDWKGGSRQMIIGKRAFEKTVKGFNGKTNF